MQNGAKTGLTTVTFRKKNIQEIMQLAADAKLDGLEIGGDVHVLPGDTRSAQSVRFLAEKKGLQLFSYGSYFRAGESEIAGFVSVLQSAEALGVPRIRIWTGWRDKAQYVDVLRDLRVVCAMAQEKGIELGLEFHNGTFNDTAEHALAILREVNAPNLFTYWQPLYDSKRNLADIAALCEVCKHVHVYNWIYGEKKTVRLALNDPPEVWPAYITALQEKTYIMEFVKDDDEKQFFADAAFLRTAVQEMTGKDGKRTQK